MQCFLGYDSSFDSNGSGGIGREEMSAEYTIDLTFTFEIISQQSWLRLPIPTFVFSTMHRKVNSVHL